MNGKTKLTLAASFVGVVAMAAAAFGQSGGGSGEEGSGSEPSRGARRAAAQEQRERCGGGDREDFPRRARRVVHSETKVKAPEGFAILTVDTGTVTAIDHADKTITIERLDGESVTATAVDETVVCKDGAEATFDAIKVGDHARLLSVRSERFTGLRRIGVHSPGSEPDEPERPAPEGSADQN